MLEEPLAPGPSPKLYESTGTVNQVDYGMLLLGQLEQEGTCLMSEHELVSASLTWQMRPARSKEGTVVTLAGKLTCQCGRIAELQPLSVRISSGVLVDLVTATMSAAGAALFQAAVEEQSLESFSDSHSS